MDGHDLSRRLTQLLNEDSGSGWLDPRSTYDFLWEAATALVDRTGCLRSEQQITTIAGEAEYNLNPDFIRLYLKNNNEELIIKYTNGSTDSFIIWTDYEDIVYANETASSVPSSFSIIDSVLPDQVSGTAKNTGASTGGLSQLSDITGDFSDVAPGSTVHNITDGSSGVVVSKTSSTAIKTALFGGTNNDWTTADEYIIQPQGRLKLVLNTPVSSSGDTIIVYYIQRPDPVYHSYGAYRIPAHYQTALLKYALWLYKYRDRQPNTGDALYKFWELETKRAGHSINQATRPNYVKVSFKKHG